MYQQIFIMQYILGMSSADVTCTILPTVVKSKKNVFFSTSLAKVYSRILCMMNFIFVYSMVC